MKYHRPPAETEVKKKKKCANKKSQVTQCCIVLKHTEDWSGDKILIMNGNLIPDMYVMTGSICETALIHILCHRRVYGKSKWDHTKANSTRAPFVHCLNAGWLEVLICYMSRADCKQRIIKPSVQMVLPHPHLATLALLVSIGEM